LSNLKGADRNKAEGALADTLIDNLGLGEFVDSSGHVDVARWNRAMAAGSLAIQQSPNFVARLDPRMPGYSEYVKGHLTQEDLKRPEYRGLRSAIGRAAAGAGLTSYEVSAAQGHTVPTEEGITRAGVAISGAALDQRSPQAQLDQTATAQFREMTAQARQAAQSMGGMVQAINAFNKVTEGLVGKLSDSTAEDFRKAGQVASKDFKIGADIFKTSVKDFSDAVKSWNVSDDRLKK
jgi:hypothetical protein